MAGVKWGQAMINVLEIDGYRAVIEFDSEIEMFRGEFIDLNGGADFYATDVKGLWEEARKSLAVFLDMCREDGVEPHRQFTGQIAIQLPPRLYADIAAAARVQGQTLDEWVERALDRQVAVQR